MILSTRCGSAAVLAVFVLSAVSGCSEPASKQEAGALVAKWYQDRASNWSLIVDDSNAAHRFHQGPDAQACKYGVLDLIYSTSDYDVALALTCPGAPTPDLAGLISANAGGAVGHVPTELSLPGWVFTTFSTGGVSAQDVEYLSWDGGRISVVVNKAAIFLSARQTSEDCQGLPDKISNDCYIPATSVPLKLTITAPLDMTAVRLAGQ